MNTMYKTNAAAALMPAQDKPQLTVVRGIRTRRTSLADELAIHMFGHLNGNDFASDVHDVLDARVRPGFLKGSREHAFACVASVLGAVALFAFSFM